MESHNAHTTKETQLLHQVFEDQARKNPDSLALDFYPNETLTYRELNERSNGLARFLCENQVSGRDVVALCLDKSPFLIIAVLAVLKAGMVWIPLPMDATEDRIQYILQSSEVGLIFGTNDRKPQFVQTNLCFIALDEMFQGNSRPPYPTTNLDHISRTENDLCHILFTSGSTGVPKGVLTEHRAVRHNAVALSKMFQLDSSTRTLQFAAPTFDIFGLDLFMTFNCGGCLVIAPKEVMMEDLTVFMHNTHVTYAQLTPTVIQTVQPDGVPELCTLTSSGEALPQELASKWRHRVRLFNAYGPTETIVCTVEDLTENAGVESACIGRAVSGLEVRLIVDGEAREVPVGEVGEICVAGPQVLRSYLSKDGPIQPPEVYMNGVRFYRTGDLGFWDHSQGRVPTIKLMGRRDAEVKLRGIRLDLGDVEQSVLSCPYVSECLVVMPRRGPSTDRLSCFVVLNTLPPTPPEASDSAPQQQEPVPLLESTPVICSMLQEAKAATSIRQPALAVPKTWWPIQEMPLTTSGKTNRFKLQSWLENLSEQEFRSLIEQFAVGAAERSTAAEPEELLLQTVWAEVLLRPATSISATDSIADLGADSLDVIKMATAARKAGVNISAADIFSAKTIQELLRRSPSLHSEGSSEPPQPLIYRPFTSLEPSQPLAPLINQAAQLCGTSMGDIEDIYPCTPYQSALMVLDIKAPGSYICAFSWTLRGDIEIARLNNAWNILMSSYSVLRNRLVWDGSTQQFLQVQVKHAPIKWAESHYEAPMTLGSDLCRVIARRQENTQKWSFHLKIHHSIVDGWSLGLMLNQLKKMYFGETVNTLEAATYGQFIQYHVEQQRKMQDGSERFWTEYLRGCSESEFPPAPQDAHHQVHATTHQSAEVRFNLKELASRLGVTPAIILYGITSLVLATHGDTDDVVMGLILAGRDVSVDGVFQMIGPAFASVPLRTRVDHQMSLPEYFENVQKDILSIIPHQQYGLERIKKCGPGAAVACQLQTLLVVQPEDEALAGSGLWETVHGQTSGIADSVPFSVELILSDNGVLINCNSDPAILSPQYAQMVTDHLRQALESLAGLSGENKLKHIQLSTEEQRSGLLKWSEWYGPPIDSCLHAHLHSSAEKFADSIAIHESATGEKLTYRELDLRSSQLAVYLIESLQLSENAVIPIAMEKSALAIISIFAILKSGCAYLPLDPSWPIERVRGIVSAAGAIAITCSPEIAAQYKSLEHRLVPIDTSFFDDKKDISLPTEWVPRGSPSDLAVLMYTSGSTGVPKGVMLEHRALGTSLTHLSRVFALQPGYNHLQFSAFIYDVSIADIFITLLSGACICVPTEDERLNRLSETIRRMDISSAILTPSMTSLIAFEDASSLRTIMTGGEMTSRALIQSWAPRIRFLNAYGPTEASITTTVTDPLETDSDPGVIGRNVTGWHLILRRNQDGQLYEAPFGCTGEIAIAGHSVARGYLNNPELTNKSFVTLPEMEKYNLPSRIYLTGDIGRYEHDGSVRILGRRDRMIKINGVRVDPGEAEAQLRKLGGLFSSAVVQCVVDENKVSRLATFIPEPSSETSSAQGLILLDAVTAAFREECVEARQRLLQLLPGPYIPSLFVPISYIPSTGSDKTDLKRLRDELDKFSLESFIVTAEKGSDDDKLEYLEAATPIEALMESVFRKVFRKDVPLSMTADFFRLGGDSFTAIKLVSVAKEHNLEITVQQLYENSQLRALASVALYNGQQSQNLTSVETEQSTLPSSRVVSDEIWLEVVRASEFPEEEVEEIYPATPFQEGLMATSLHEASGDESNSRGTYQAAMAFKLAPNTDAARLAQSMERLVSKHSILRTSLIFSSKGLMQLTRKPSRGKDGKFATLPFFDYEIDVASAKLTIWMHHALYDAPTVHILLEDINSWYRDLDSVGSVSTPYKKYVQYLQSTSPESASRYWSEYLQDSPVASFPSVGESQNKTKATNHIDLSMKVSLDLSKQSGISGATLVTGAVALLLSSYGFAEQVCFGMTFSGRDIPELETIVGPTLSTLPIRVHISREESTTSFLKQIQSSVLEMRQHQHFGLKNISRLPDQGPRNASRFRTLLVVQQGSEFSEVTETGKVIEKLLSNESSMHVEYPLAIIGTIDSASGRLDLRVEFDSDCLSIVEAQRFISQLEQTVTELSRLHSQVSDVGMASSQDISDISKWNPQPSKAPSTGIRQMFQEVALKQPDNIALDSIDGKGFSRITYKELDDVSTALAGNIAGHAPAAGIIVLCHQKPSFIIAGMLAIWKAGKAFATIDSSVPTERRQRILKDLGDETVVLTIPSEAESFAPYTIANFDELMLNAQSVARQSSIEKHSYKGSDTAYIFFTSGSSGTPKGVVVSHSSIALSMSDVSAMMELGLETRMFQFATCAFDTSLLEIFATLIAGGCVCIPTRSQRIDGSLSSAIDALQATHLVLTPTVAGLLSPMDLPTLRSLMLIGEPPSKQLIEAWSTSSRRRIQLLNGYGPTEASVHSSTNLVLQSTDPQNIGQATACNLMLVMPDDTSKLAPVGAVGELIILGDTVADGYLNQAEQSSRVFGADLAWAFWTDATSPIRYYLTGDLARYSPDGSIIYLGRKDLQTKIHGQRVELAEIEHNIRQSAQFTDCVVEFLPPSTLVAFVLIDELKEISYSGPLPPGQIDEAAVARVQSRLRSRLPEYMIPSVFVPCGCWPTSISGKIDRRRLRAAVETSLNEYRVHNTGPKRPAETAKQKALVSSIAEVMAIAEYQIGLDDSVVALGGDSISMIRIMALARQQGLDIDMSKAHQSISIEDMIADSNSNAQQPVSGSNAPPAPFSLITWAERDALCAKAAAQCNVQVESISDIYFCTPMQEALMISSAKTRGAFLNQEVFRIENVSVPSLCHAIESLWGRHAILRTRIILEQDRSLQVVLQETDNVSTHNAQSIEEFLAQDGLLYFGYGVKLSRCQVVLSQSNTYVVLSQHHAVFDGWSMKLLKDELEALCGGNNLPLPPTPSYASFAKYSKDICDSTAASKFWQEKLEGIHAGPLPQVRSGTSFNANQKHAISIQFSNKTSYTLATLAEAAWGVLLGRYLDSDDVTFGVVRSGRTVPITGIDQLMGPTLASIPRRLHVSPEQDTNAYLAHVQNEVSLSVPWEQYGLSNIRKIHEDASHACKFNSLLVIQPPAVAQDQEDHKGHIISEDQIGKGTVDSDCLMVDCQATGDNEVTISIIYDDHLTSKEDVHWMAYHLSEAIKALSTDEKSAIGHLNVSGSERLIQEQEWNNVKIDSCSRRVDEIFSERAQGWPKFPAVEAPDASLTYEQLDALSSIGAFRLQTECGVRRGDLVPLLMSKGAAMIVAMFSILKAGCAYVPLQTDAPLERLQFLLSEISSSHVVITANHHKLAQTLPGKPIIWDVVELLKRPTPAPIAIAEFSSAEATPESESRSDLAYVLFTSGSTGTPKGVMIEHSALATTALTNGRLMEYQPKTRTLSFAAYTFDVNVIEIYLTLLHGGCLFIPPDNRRLGDLCAYLNENKIELAFLTPTTIQNLLRSPSQVPSLKTLRSGGEPLSKSIMQEWCEHVRLINSYGPTETCVDACRNPDITINSEPKNIGFAIGTHLWVVEQGDYNSLAPVGCPGELLISGPTLARGYFKNEEKTRAAFIDGSSYPWILPGEERLYVTGDVVQRNADGSITFVGRRDLQVKVNGFRIELGEVEHNLERCPSVTSAAVEKATFQEDDSEMLVAFLILEQPGSSEQDLLLPPSTSIRSIIQGVQARIDGLLPPYMVPRVYLPLSRIPLTSSGKTDRKALQQIVAPLTPEEILPYQAALSVIRQPTTATERILQGLWAHVLKIDPKHLGLDTQFTRVGGDSLAAINLASLCREIGFNLDVADILRVSQLEKMASHIQNDQGRTKLEGQGAKPQKVAGLEACSQELRVQSAHVCDLPAEDIEDVYPCTPIQESLIAATVRQPKTYIDHSMFRIPASVNTSELRAAWDTVHEVNPILRTRICALNTDRGVRMMQVVTSSLSTWIDVDSEGDTLLKIGLGTPLAYYRIRSSETGSILETWRHHAIFDGFSSAALWNDLTHALTQFGPPKPRPSYRKYVEFVQNVDQAESTSFWKAQLNGLQPEAFPTIPSPDYLPEANSTSSITLQSRLDWNSDSPFSFATVSRAAWAIVLAMRSRIIGSDKDVCFAATVSGRMAPLAGIEDIVGPTITTVPVRLQFNVDEVVSALLQRVQDQALQMISFEHLGLGRIREISASIRDACASVNLLVVQPAHLGDSALPLGLERVNINNEGLSEPFGLIMECSQSGTKDGISVSAAYDTSLLDATEVSHILQQFQQLISILHRHAGDNSTIRSSLWDVAEGSELQRIIEWNSPADLTPPTQLHKLVEDSAVHNPEQLAIDCHDGQMTYVELVEAANALALQLQEVQGVRPGDLVPLCTEKSLSMIVGMLGIMKAGAGYVPLDTNHPEARMKLILDEIRAQFILVSHLQSSRREFPIQVVALDMNALSDPKPSRELSYASGSDDIAYVIFTSGSSGTPKGVVMEHKAASRSILEHAKRYQHDRQGVHRKSLQFSSYTFDASVVDIFAVLACGGTVCVPSETQGVNELEGFIQSKQINFADLTPTVVNLLDPSQVPSLTTLAIGGEMANRAVVQKWAGPNSPVELFFNAYGPTEAGIACAVGQLTVDSLIGSVGKALGAGLWIVDDQDHNRLVPVGAVGELVATGKTLARGYLNDEEKTRLAFLEDAPWLSKVGETRLYKTGDLARFDAHGNVEIAGRREDTQIKFRGLRIELGEIETAIGALPRIQRVAVTKIERNEIPLLAAFVQLPNDDECTTSSDPGPVFRQPSESFGLFVGSAQESLRKQLPEYMVPALWLPVSKWPLLASSKSDRKRLSSLAESLSSKIVSNYQKTALVKNNRAPSAKLGSIEESIKEAWIEVLRKGPSWDVDSDDDFFQQGGDSLTTIMLVTILRQKGVHISASQVFAGKTLRGMASRCKGSDPAEDGATNGFENGDHSAPELDGLSQAASQNCINGHLFNKPSGLINKLQVSLSDVEEIYPTSHTQLTFIIEAQKWPRSYYSWAFFELDDSASADRVKKACQTLVSRHPILRTSFHLLGGRCFQAVRSSAIDFKVMLAPHDSDLICSAVDWDTGKPVGFGRVLTRFRLVIDPESGIRTLALGLSHAQYDGFSLSTIWNDLRSAYLGISTDAKECAGYSHYIQHTLDLSNEKTDSFWRELLQGSSLSTISNVSSSELPIMGDSIMRTVPFQLQNSGQTNYGALLKTAWAITLSAISNSADVSFWNLVSGRFADFEGAQDVVGPAINFVPVRARFDVNQPISNLMKTLHDQQIECVPFEATPTDRIIRQAGWSGSSSSLGTIFQYQNIPDPKEHSGDADSSWTIKGSAVYGGGLLQSGACWLLAWPTTDGRSSFRFTFSPQTVSHAGAESVMNLYLDILHAMNNDPESTISSLIPTEGEKILPHQAPVQSGQEQADMPQVLQAMQPVLLQIESIWNDLLALPGSIDQNKSFFDLGGDSLKASELAEILVEAGFDFTLQDIIDFPTLRLQTLWVSGQISRPTRKVPQLQFRLASELS